jgi:hypothetical protein
MLYEKNTKTDNPRTLEIKLMIALQRKQWIGLTFFLIMTGAFVWRLFYDVTREPFMTSTQAIVWAVITVMMMLRIRYLKSIFLRIDDNGFSWRLVEGGDMLQRMRPPISEHVVRWESVRELHHEASRIRFSFHDKKDVFLPLSDFSYAQRQDIKRVIGLHLSEHDITAFVFTPVGWHDDPEGDEGDDASVQGSPTTEPR